MDVKSVVFYHQSCKASDALRGLLGHGRLLCTEGGTQRGLDQRLLEGLNGFNGVAALFALHHLKH